jgi:methyl-accepting chemotaxis protein
MARAPWPIARQFQRSRRPVGLCLGEIVDGCDAIRRGTDEIAAASGDLARRTEHQASSIAETSRTLNEFTGTVRVTADNARQTSSRLATTRNTAEAADQQAEQAVHGLRPSKPAAAKWPRSSA